MKLDLFICLVMVALVLTGCPDLQKFADAVDQSNATWSAASEDLKVLGRELQSAAAAYDAAIKSDDKTEIDKAKYILEDIAHRYESKEKEVATAKTAVESTIKQYEDAKAQGNYLWTIPGMILGGITGALGLKLKLGPVVSALAKTVSNARSTLSDEGLESLKDKQAETMTPAEKKVVARALGKG